LNREDLYAGELKLENPPHFSHPAIPADQAEGFTKIAIIGTLLSIHQGAWSVSEEWNKLLPDYQFVSVEEYLKKIPI
jgi:hypothetical protein